MAIIIGIYIYPAATCCAFHRRCRAPFNLHGVFNVSRLSRSHRTRARQGAANADLTPAQSKRQIEVHEAQRAEAKAEEQLYIDDEKFASLQEEVEEKT